MKRALPLLAPIALAITLAIAPTASAGPALWHLSNSIPPVASDYYFSYGNWSSTHIPIAGDWNGSGRDTAGIVDKGYSPMKWFLRNSHASGAPDQVYDYGSSGSQPVSGDYACPNSHDKPVVFQNGSWYFRRPSGSTLIRGPFGSAGNIALLRDGNQWSCGADMMVFNPSNAYWQLTVRRSAPYVTDLAFYYGVSGDIPLLGDWDGDGMDTPGVFRPSNRTFYLDNEYGTAPEHVFQWGYSHWKPVVGDWNDNGQDTIGMVGET